MSTIEDRPTTGERYSSAMESSNLRLGERRGDVDYLIAAALIRNPLAAALYRLQVEFDAVREAHRAATQRMRDSDAYAKREARKSPEAADAILRAAENAALIDHVLILSQLQSLAETKEIFGAWCEQEAQKRRFMVPTREVAILAGQLLEVFLSPNCRACGGRKFTGSMYQGELQTPCRQCRGSGHRRDDIGRTDEQRRLAGHVTLHLSALMDEAQQQIRTGLNRVEMAKEMIRAVGG